MGNKFKACNGWNERLIKMKESFVKKKSVTVPEATL
jgi:hypothetical protein